MRVLVVTAVAAEAAAVVRAFDSPADGAPADPRRGTVVGCGAGELTVLTAGVGSAAAAAATASALGTAAYDCVVSMGVAGGFRDRASVGDVVVADRVVAADLGAETADGFRSMYDLLGVAGDQVLGVPDPRALAARLTAAGLTTRTGAILTVNTVTGTDQRAAALAARHPTAVAEAMEGYGVVLAAVAAGTPAAEVRTVSNVVERRDRAAWDLPGALAALSRAAAALFAAPLPTDGVTG